MNAATAEIKQPVYKGLIGSGLEALSESIADKKAEAADSRRNRAAGRVGQVLFGKDKQATKVVSAEVAKLGNVGNIVDASLKIVEKALSKDEKVKSANTLVVADGDQAVGFAFAPDGRLAVSIMDEHDGSIRGRNYMVGEDGVDKVTEGSDILDGRKLDPDELITGEEFLRLEGSVETHPASTEEARAVYEDLHFFSFAGPDMQVSTQ